MPEDHIDLDEESSQPEQDEESLQPEAADYWLSYGISNDPFLLDDSSELFLIEQWEEHLELLQHLSQYGNSILVLSGEALSGKTTLLHQFRIAIRESMSMTHLDASENFDSVALFKHLTDAFQLASVEESETALKEKTDSLLEAMRSNGQNYLLIIDDAEKLPSKTLEVLLFLVNAQASGQVVFHVAMFGETAIQNTLHGVGKEFDKEKLVNIIELKPLSLEDTQAYIAHCITKAGGDLETMLTTTELEEIYARSKGYIGRSASECALVLKAHSGVSVPSSASMLGQHKVKLIAGAALALIFTVGITLVNTLLNSGTANMRVVDTSPLPAGIQPPEVVIQALRTAKKVHASLANKNKLPIPDSAAALAENMVQAPKLPEPKPPPPPKPLKPVLQYPPQPVVEDIHTLSPDGVNTHKLTTHRTLRLALKKSNGKPYSLTKNTHASTANRQATPFPTVATKAAQQRPDLQSISAVPSAKRKTNVKVKASQPLKKVNRALAVKPITKKQLRRIRTTKRRVVVKQRLTRFEHQIMNVRSQYYALQLVSSGSEANIKRFIKVHRLSSGQAHYYRVRRNGRNWYVLVYGKYSNRAEAKSVIRYLPPSLRRLHPWPRSYSDIHKAIKERRS